MTDHIQHVAYEYASRRGVVAVAEGHSTSMEDTVYLFRRIDPAVERIYAFSGPTPTAVYVRHKNTWVARTQKGVTK